MTQAEFEQWINNPHMTAKKMHPGAWKGSKEEIAEWERNRTVAPAAAFNRTLSPFQNRSA